MGSGEPAAGVDWLPLAPDAAVTGGAPAATTDPTAGGALHWAPLGEPGMRCRAETVSAWARESGCRLLVVDVSVEMLLLGRLLGLPTVAVLQPGDRTDPAHVLGYSTASALLAPWPERAQGRDRGQFADKTTWTGAFSGFDGRAPEVDRDACLPGRCAVLVLGRGGHGVGAADVRAAADATAGGWHWHVAGDLVEDEPVDHGRVVEHGRVADVWPLLCTADVVVGPCGGGLVADVAAAGMPFLALPQPRPFGEQVALGRLLRRAGVATVQAAWPSAPTWPRLLDELTADPAATAGRWRRWVDGSGAARAAAVVRAAGAIAPVVRCPGRRTCASWPGERPGSRRAALRRGPA